MKRRLNTRTLFFIKVARYSIILFFSFVFILVGFPGIWYQFRMRTGLLGFFLKFLNSFWLSLIVFIVGAFLLWYAIRKIFKALNDYIKQAISDPKIMHYVIESDVLSKERRYVVIGGGTGISNLLLELKQSTSNITAIVTVTDEGGSSGRLRESMNVLPPGDLRNCLVALAENDSVLAALFKYRFSAKELAGHSLGNLLIAGLTEMEGDIVKALITLEKILAIRGRVYPSTIQNVRLKAVFEDGEEVIGEVNIASTPKQIKRIYLMPSDVAALPESIDAIRKADFIFLGPGSLYTSIIPNLLIKDVNDALRQTKAKKFFIANIMTQRYETHNLSMAAHIEALEQVLPIEFIDYILIHDRPLPESLLKKYAGEESYPVEINKELLRTRYGSKIIYGDYLREDSNYLRHSAHKILSVLKEKRLI